MEERLQKIIAARAGISRRKAEELIAAGRITVDGAEAVLGQRADPESAELRLDGEPLGPAPEHKVYIMLNKPVGYVTTMSDEKGRKTVRDLVTDIPERVYPVGRLDINSEGLLILTNDGDFANRLMHPSFEKEKIYLVTVTGDLDRGLETLTGPMELDGVALAAPKIKIVRRDGGLGVLQITIHEGRNRQIRRMCEQAGLSVSRLTRIAEGGVSLGRLKKGTWRHLTREELLKLRRGS